jgi:diguanylate cyclase (GGDEF)-like protein
VNDLRVRLPELARKSSAPAAKARKSATPVARPGDGILDALTGFYTFAHFKEVLFIEAKRSRRYGLPLSLAMIAFDPIEGDVSPQLRAQLYSGLALSIRRLLRDTDFPVQFNPDRVMLLMPHTDLRGALILARRICERVAKARVTHEDGLVNPTVSVGIAALNQDREQGFGQLVQNALKSLEQAQDMGGNRAEFHDSAQVAAVAEGFAEEA